MKVRKKRRKKNKLRWWILAIPLSIFLIGAGIVFYFGFDLTKQSALLAHTVVDDYDPPLPDRKFEQPWTLLPVPGESLGSLKFPSIKLTVPVVQGTHENELKKGAGHMAGTALPGQGGHVILSGHRDTVFTQLKDLKKGDQVVFTTMYGDFVYQAVSFKIVPANDRTVAVPTDYETLTLTTCYPFNFVGDAPDRYVVYTKLISQPKIEKF